MGEVLMYKQLVDHCQVRAIALSGSLTKLGFVQEVIAELLRIPILIVTEQHAPQLGSFMMLTEQMARVWNEVPGSSRSGYGEKFAAWCNLLDSLRPSNNLPEDSHL